jgi:hypothetical protein
MFSNKNTYPISLMLLLALSSCSYFGKKTDLGFIAVPKYSDKQVAYVPVLPAMSGLQYPVDVIVGYDQLIYVADQGTGEVKYYDLSGGYIGKLPYKIPNLQSITQDRRLDILAVGTYDTTINFNGSSHRYTLAAVYRLDTKQTSGYGLKFDTARLQRVHKIVHPFYFKSTLSSSDTIVRFQSVATLFDNSYYVSRNGNNNSTTQIGGPDDAVLYFYSNDKFVSPVYVQTSSGLLSNYFQKPKGITSVAQPPQSSSVNQSGDFVYTSLAPQNALKVQLISKISGDNGTVYTQFYTGYDTSKADGFIYQGNRFSQPTDVTIAGDETKYLFVVDADKDSLYEFNSLGLEGVTPPPSSVSKKLIKVSFGGRGTSYLQFNHPMGVAYYNKTVYVADAGNGRILRFKLTTDIQ